MKLRMQEAYTAKMLIISEDIYGYFCKTLQRVLDIHGLIKVRITKSSEYAWMCLNNL